MLAVGDKAKVRYDDRHPKGQIVVVKFVISPKYNEEKPYYCQTEGGQVCSYYGEEDLEKVNENRTN